MMKNSLTVCDRRRSKVHRTRHGKRLVAILVRKRIASMNWFKNWERAGSDTSHGWGMPSVEEEAFLLKLLSSAVMYMVRISVPLAPFSPGQRSLSSAGGKK